MLLLTRKGSKLQVMGKKKKEFNFKPAMFLWSVPSVCRSLMLLDVLREMGTCLGVGVGFSQAQHFYIKLTFVLAFQE